MTEEKDKVVLKGQDAIDLYMQGKDAWNAWVRENPVADVDFSHQTIEANLKEGDKKLINFSEFQFPEGKVWFYDATFGEGDVRFSKANFGEGDVRFSKANFGEGSVDFSYANFGGGDVNF